MAAQTHYHGFGGRQFVQFDPSAFVADPKLLLALEERSSPVACDSERVLFRQDDEPAGLYILQRGHVTLTMASGREEPMFAVVAEPGSLLGLPGLAGNQPYTLTAVAQPGAQVGFVPREDFVALMQSDPAISLKILQVLAAEVRSARRAIA
jgi:CRP/FNR family transcriptional regulator